VFVDILDAIMTNSKGPVTERDLTFNPHRVHFALDELICDGVVCETSKTRVCEIISQMDGMT
jgi:hypothetical protein